MWKAWAFQKKLQSKKKENPGTSSGSKNNDKEREALVASDCRYFEHESDRWFLDSGASEHMTFHREWFSTFEKLKDSVAVKIGDGKVISALGFGKIFVRYLLMMKLFIVL